MDLRNAPIGVFDSGVGGLTVAKEIMNQIPNERIVYFGDTARVPYGAKSKETVIKYTRQIIRFLKTHNVKALVIACGTMSANALEIVEKEIDLPIIGVVKPGATTACAVTRNKRVGVVATESSINSGMYPKFIREINPEITVYGKACPLFCPLVEEGMLDDPVTDEIARRYLKEVMDKDIDSLILGCTHYPLLAPAIKKIVGDTVTLVNPAYETAKELESLLKMKDMLSLQSYEKRGEKNEYYVSDAAEKFKDFASIILDDRSLTTSVVEIESF